MDPKGRFLSACRGLAVDRPPVWMMRQAGRTLPEYQKLRSNYSFWQLCRTPELAAEVTLQPVRRFCMDVAVIFSDILVVPAALGLEVRFSPQVAVSPPVRTAADVERLLRAQEHADLTYVAEAVRCACEAGGPGLAVLGFAGAPFTLACYMVEGGASRHFEHVRGLMYGDPRLFERLLGALSTAIANCLWIQIDAGAAAVQLFDTWAGELSASDYRRFILPGMQNLVQRLRPAGVPIIYHVNGIGNLLEVAAETGADVLGIDWRVDLGEVRRRVGPHRAVQGNLDPAVLFAPPDFIRERVFAILDQTGGRGHVVNLGHGVIPGTPLTGIQAFVNAVRQWGEARHG